ncbi:MAG: hypothetical protein KC636_35800, partial [Myxococcales bacterium]|nr:hypothetical protein [Myxococcales bacterium]
SVGLEFDRNKRDLPVKSKGEFLAFLRSHRCLDELLGPDAELLDFRGLLDLKRCARQHFSADRWYLTGMSGFFVEVIGSATSRIYSESNRMIERMIRADLAGDRERLAGLLDTCNTHLRATYEAFNLFLGDYELFGSFELFSSYFGVGLAEYFNAGLNHAMSDLDALARRAEVDPPRFDEGFDAYFEASVLAGLRAATHRLARELYEFLVARGAYFRGNHGRYADSNDWEQRADLLTKIGAPRCPERELAASRRSWEMYVRRLLAVMCSIEQVEFDERAFRARFQGCWRERQTLAELLDVMKRASDFQMAGGT